MKIILVDKEERNKLIRELKKCLNFLYRMEDLTDYKEKDISKCIDLLQNIKIMGVIYENTR